MMSGAVAKGYWYLFAYGNWDEDEDVVWLRSLDGSGDISCWFC